MIHQQIEDISAKIKPFKYLIVNTDCGGDDCQALILLLFSYIKRYNKILLGIKCC
jgi:hypothetical protein